MTDYTNFPKDLKIVNLNQKLNFFDDILKDISRVLLQWGPLFCYFRKQKS